MALTITVTVATVLVIAALLWGHGRKQEEKRLRKQGVMSIPVDSGHIVTAGCLGVLGYLGLLFITVTLTIDLFGDTAGPDWLPWVFAITLLVGFFGMAGWAAFGIGSSFATTRLVVDQYGIQLRRLGKARTTIFWDRRWKLLQLAKVRRVRYRAFDYGTEYTLIMRLSQGRAALTLAFDAQAGEIGGLAPYEGPDEGYSITKDAQRLKSELLFRHERWAERDEDLPVGGEARGAELKAVAPDAELMSALNFTEEQLVLNRNLRYEPSQVSQIRSDRKLTLATYLVLAALFGAGSLYILNLLLQGHSFESAGPFLVVFLLVTGFCLLMAASTRWELKSDIRVEQVSGPIRLQHYRQSGEYWLRVGKEGFQISKQLFHALEDRASYHLYVARHGVDGQDKKLLSAEKLAQTNAGQP